MPVSSDTSSSVPLKSAREKTRSMCQPSSSKLGSEPSYIEDVKGKTDVEVRCTVIVGSTCDENPTVVRQKLHPEVSFHKGGSDFRCPVTFSCFGRQVISRDIYRNPGTPAFTQQDRWFVPGDKFKAHGGTPISSLGNQPTSTRISAGRAHFGTSTRSSAMKMYALWSVGQQR